MEALLLATGEMPRFHATSTRSPPSSNDETSDDSHDRDSDSRETIPRRPPVKNRKTTYYTRKDELESLQKQSVALSNQVESLREAKRRRQQPLLNSLAVKASLQSHVAQSRQFVAGAQSLVASYTARTADPQIGSYIHLPAQSAERQRAIDAMKPHKIQEALMFILARYQYSDLRYPSRQLENYVTPRGDHVAIQWEVFHIDHGPYSVYQVHDEMVEFLRTQEMALAEQNGIVSVREGDFEESDLTATQLKVLASHGGNLTVEKNIVQVSEYFTRSDLLDQPHAVHVVDYVDQDDAFPYQPESRIRKDVAAARLIVQCESRDPSKPPVIAVIQWSYLNIHPTSLTTPQVLDTMAREGLPMFLDAFTREIRDRLAWRHGAASI